MIKERFIQKHKETSINILQSRIKSVRRKNIVSTGIRVYKDGFIGIAGGVGEIDERDLENQAQENLKLQIPYPYEVSKDKKLTMDYRRELPSDQNFVEEVELILKSLREEFPDFIFSNSMSITEIETQLSNDQGLELISRDRMALTALVIKEKDSVNVFDAFSTDMDRIFNRDKILENTRNILNAYKNPIELPEKSSMPVIFFKGDTTPLSKLIMELDGYKIGTGASLFKDFMGEKKFNEDFSFYQSAQEEDKTLQTFFDAEGVVNQDFKYALIENGKILNAYTDKKTAAQFDLALTGSAQAAYDKVPSLAPTNYSVGPSGKTLKEILDGDLAVLCFIASGGDFTQEGAFASPVQLAFLTDGERLLGRLPEVNISGDIYQMFGQGYRGLSKDKLLDNQAMVINLNVEEL